MWSLAEALELHDALLRHSTHQAPSITEFQSALSCAASLMRLSPGDAERLHEALITLYELFPAGGSPSSSRWLASLRRDTTSSPVSPSALKSFSCAMVALADEPSVTLAEKLEAGFVICGGKNRTLDLHGLLTMLQGAHAAVQLLLRGIFAEQLPPSMTEDGASIFCFEWVVIEGLLRDGALAPLFELERGGGAAASGAAAAPDVAGAGIDGGGDAGGGLQRRGSLRFALRGSSTHRFPATQLSHMLLGYIDQVSDGRGHEVVWANARHALDERARSLSIDASLEQEQQQQQRERGGAGGTPATVLVVGREGAGKRSLLHALTYAFHTVGEHTNLDGSGLRQLCLVVDADSTDELKPAAHGAGASRTLTLLDIGSSIGAAAAEPARLRKALRHFDALDGAVVVVALDQLCTPADAKLSAQLVATVCSHLGRSRHARARAGTMGLGGSTGGGGGGGGGGELSPGLCVLLAKMDLAPMLLATDAGLGATLNVEREDDLLHAARQACLACLAPEVAEHVEVLPVSSLARQMGADDMYSDNYDAGCGAAAANAAAECEYGEEDLLSLRAALQTVSAAVSAAAGARLY